ncbi:TPA: Arc family DNA-binding protein [Morganella morganii]
MAKKDVQLNIRMTQELKDRIEKSAKSNNRTINAEAITLIESALSGNVIPSNFIPSDLIDEMPDHEANDGLNKRLDSILKTQIGKFIEQAEDAIRVRLAELKNTNQDK